MSRLMDTLKRPITDAEIRTSGSRFEETPVASVSAVAGPPPRSVTETGGTESAVTNVAPRRVFVASESGAPTLHALLPWVAMAIFTGAVTAYFYVSYWRDIATIEHPHAGTPERVIVSAPVAVTSHMENDMGATAPETTAPDADIDPAPYDEGTEEPALPTFRVARKPAPPAADRFAADGYSAYRRGDLTSARESYWRALRVNPQHRDSMLGLAAIAVRRKETAQARELYLRSIDRDPNDAAAISGLIDLESPGDARARESRLKGLIAAHPDAAHPRFALGNLYASERRWSEAQASYGEALALDHRDALHPEQKHPDYAFNRAVAFEHLNRHRDALYHYRAALRYALTDAPAFVPAVATARVSALEAVVGGGTP